MRSRIDRWITLFLLHATVLLLIIWPPVIHKYVRIVVLYQSKINQSKINKLKNRFKNKYNSIDLESKNYCEVCTNNWNCSKRRLS